MGAAIHGVFLGCLVALATGIAQTKAGESVKAALCDLAKNPAAYEGKRLEIRALVETGVGDLPAGVADDRCGVEVKFLTPDDQHLAILVKNHGFRKLAKEVKKHPVVEATVTGLFHAESAGPTSQPVMRLLLESVDDVTVKR